MRFTAAILSLATLATLSACSEPTNVPPVVSTTPDSVVSDNATAWSLGYMAAVANPYATDAAVEMLRQGGHAVDAAIAAHAVLGLVEPESSGLGGGAANKCSAGVWPVQDRGHRTGAGLWRPRPP